MNLVDDGTPAPPIPSEPAPALGTWGVDWRIIGLGAPLALVVAAVTIIGLGSVFWEGVAWALAGFGWIALVHWGRPPRPFAHGFLVSFVGGLIVISLQAVFIDEFLAAHPSLAQSIAAHRLSPRAFVVGTGLLGSALTALAVGAFSALVARGAR